ncbi:MAG: UDP-N-acetylmuramate dehydrogenase [bacterium]|nr:UDP-N-acetylmuramate dehydrogenase [bacterium]
MTGYGDLAPELARLLPAGRLRVNEPMARHTSFGIGGPADLLVEPENRGELEVCLAFAAEHGMPVTVIGLGTNLLVRDGGCRGLVIKMTGLGELSELPGDDGRRIRAGGGAPLAEVAAFAARRGMSGLEFASGIPGSLGGAVVMNAGAYGGEMADVVEECAILEAGGRRLRLTASDLAFGYRRSSIGDRQLVVEAVLRLRTGSPAAIRERMEEYRRRRQERQPLDQRSAGSVFRRPEGHFAGALIEEAGLRGLRVGDAQVSTRHAGFIVNVGAATARDVLALMDRIRQTVRELRGVELEPELRIVGVDAG